MARLPRYKIKNQPQHIIQRSIEGLQIFFEHQDYQYYHDCLEAAAYNYNLKIHAYALMPDHVHILASPGSEDSIPRTLQSLGRNYVQYYNESHSGVGTPWEGRYRATVLQAKTYLLNCSHYIEQNPVRAGLVKNAKDYLWSSFAHNALAKSEEIITPSSEYLALGDSDKTRARAYLAQSRKKLSAETVETITEATLHGWALGDKKFVARIEKQSGRRASPLPKGRPKGS